MARDTEALKADMKARVDAILADPEVGDDVFQLIFNAGVEVAADYLIKGMIANFLRPTERTFGGGGVVAQRIDGKFTEKIPRALTSIHRFMVNGSGQETGDKDAK